MELTESFMSASINYNRLMSLNRGSHSIDLHAYAWS